MAGVVNEGVEVTNTADKCVFLQPGGDLEHASAGVVLLHRHGLCATHEVVQHKARRHERTLPDAVLQREDKFQRFDQVRGQAGHAEFALAKPLGNKPEVQHGEVTESAVEHLGRA